MKYEKPELMVKSSAVDSVQQGQGQIPAKYGGPYVDLQTARADSDITTAAAYEADE